MDKTAISLAWAKFLNFKSPSVIGNQILSFFSEDVIQFNNLSNGETKFYTAQDKKTGDGISCLCGHKVYNIFAFAEKCFESRILLLHYPDFEIFQILSADSNNNGDDDQNLVKSYIDICFSETELLIGLTDYPDYSLKIWNYRLGQLLCRMKTNVLSQIQTIFCSPFEPFIIIQNAPKLGVIRLWEIHLTYDEALIIHRPINSTVFSRKSNIVLTFGQDGWIYFIDKNGIFYGMILTGVTPKMLYEFNFINEVKCSLTYYKGGCIIGNSTGEIHFIKKNDNNEWSEIWILKTLDIQICSIFWITTTDKLYALNNIGNLLQIEEKIGSVKFKIINEEKQCSMKYFDFINPKTEYVAIVNNTEEIILLDVSNGKTISKFILNNKIITYICSHPLYPVIAVSDHLGVIHLISYMDSKNPILCTEFHLGASKINNIRFSLSGLYLVSVDENNDFFIIHGEIGNKMEIISYYSCDQIIIDFTIYEIKNNGIQILALIDSEDNDDTIINKTLSSNNLLILSLFKPNFKIDEQKISLPNSYIRIRALNDSNDKNCVRMFGSKYMERQINILEVRRNSANIVTVLKPVQHLQHVVFNVLRSKYLLTWGNDNVVNIFDLDSLKLVAVYAAGNRRDNQIKQLQCDINREYCLSLHENGCLKCIQINPNLKNKFLNTEIFINISPENTIGFIPQYKNEGKTWLEIKEQTEYNNEIEQYRSEKNDILDDFLILKNKMKELIDNNENESAENQIPMQNFNLSPEYSESISQLARKERESEQRSLTSFIDDLNRITKWIINKTWNQMDLKCCNLRGIFTNVVCENFGLIQTKLHHIDSKVQKLILLRAIELLVISKENIFRTLWMPEQKSLVEFYAQRELNIAETSSYMGSVNFQSTNGDDNNDIMIRSTFDSKFDKYDTQSLIAAMTNLYPIDESKQKSYTFSGTSTHDFIEPSKFHYPQIETISFQQMFVEQMLNEYDILNLRKWFNQKFQDVKNFKDDQIEQIKTKNERLRYIQKELNILAKILGQNEKEFEEILDPTFSPDEEPSNILKVEEHEVSVKPYISPSTQKLLDEKAWQEEQRRLALLADDFRDRALIVMMDGVLEKRWEDEIKIDPEQPECLKSNKDPNEYTKDDLKLIEDYYEKVKFLRSERERYKKMLEDEQIHIKLTRDDQIDKFNARCIELFSLKLRVDSAIKQEEIQFFRNQMFNTKKNQMIKNQKILLDKYQEKKEKTEKLQKIIENLEKKLQDLQYRFEQLQIRDKTLDKQFKIQFGESVPAAITEIAYKFFKKRPKWPQRAWETNSILLDLINRILTKDATKSGCPLPPECYEYLSALNTNDHYSYAPNTIDPILWKNMCKLRRQKIESEFKIKACGIQIAETESTLNSYIKESNMKKLSCVAINKELIELKKQYNEFKQNISLQIVMPLELVEIHLTGHLTDFEGSSLINLSNIAEINEKIKKAGAIKLQKMNKMAIFRRKIIYFQWEHESLKILLDGTKNELKTVENIKVTVEMKACLNELTRSKIIDLSAASLENEMTARKKVLEQYLKEMDEKIKNIKEKIKIQKQENSIYDNRIQRINVQVNEQHFMRDVQLEKREVNERKERMKIILERASLIRKIQIQHSHILELVTMLELQRLRTFPTLTSVKNSTI